MQLSLPASDAVTSRKDQNKQHLLFMVIRSLQRAPGALSIGEYLRINFPSSSFAKKEEKRKTQKKETNKTLFRGRETTIFIN